MHAHRRRRLTYGRIAALLLLAAVLAGVVVVAGNVAGVGDKVAGAVEKVALLVNPPPDRPIEEGAVVTPKPDSTPTLAPGQTPPPTPDPTPVPNREKMDVSLYRNPDKHFITEIDHEWCAVAGTQMVLAANGKAPLTEAFQAELAGRIGEWESRRDSRNGGWGPSAMVKALESYGVPGYEVRRYETRADALRDAARAIEQFDAPVLLMAWRGAHTWVMTGFRSDADPLLFDDARISGAYVLDPWYPRVSSIWGPSDPPGTFQDASEMRRNYLPWERPEGAYPSRDGLFLALVPTLPVLAP